MLINGCHFIAEENHIAFIVGLFYYITINYIFSISCVGNVYNEHI